ncbi:hypothetical protein PV350_14070 [Streptomyces sp. PA03-6a]|nr:hypothetical protein [Streptomyces sp. PA03-6a]
MKSVPIAAVAVAALLAVPACTSPSGGRPSPATASADGQEVRAVMPTWIHGLRVIGARGTGGACRWSTSYPSVPGARPLTRTLDREVHRGLRDFLAAHGHDAGCAGEFTISYTFLAASGDVLGVQLTTAEGAAAGDGTTSGSGTTTATYWYDGRSGEVLPALAMLGPDAAGDLAGHLVRALAARAGHDPRGLRALQDPAARRAVLDDLAFTGCGNLVVTFDRGEVAAPPTGRQKVVLPRAAVEPLLSAFGRRVQRQAMRPRHEQDG